MSELTTPVTVEMIRDEVDEITGATLHGPLPLKTSMRFVEHVVFLLAALAESEARVTAFERKEYICQRCWLRHDPPNKEVVEF